MHHHPPWIFLLLAAAGLATATPTSTSTTTPNPLTDKEAINTTRVRPQREAGERERRLVPYMAFYVAHTFPNQAGERQTVLIPVQGTADKDQAGVAPVSSLPTNTVQQPVSVLPFPSPVSSLQVQLLPRAVLMRLNEAGFLQSTQSNPQTQAGPAALEYTVASGQPNQVVGHVYAYKGPGPRPSPLPPQAQIRLHTQKYIAPPLHRVHPPTAKTYPASPANLATLANLARQPHSYTSTKLQGQAGGKDTQPYYKNVNRPLNENEHMVYTVDIRSNGDVINRLRPRLRQEKNKYTATKIYVGSTTASPYTTKVKFELEDARVPGLGSQSDTPLRAELGSTPFTYTTNAEQSSTVGGLSEYLETPGPRQTYYTHDVHDGLYASHGVAEPDNDIQTVTYGYDEQRVVNILPVAEHAKKHPQPAGQPANVLTVLKQTNKLPQHLTPDNIDGSIKTLALILEKLQHNDKRYQRPPYSGAPAKIPHKTKTPPVPSPGVKHHPHSHRTKVQSYPQPSGTSTPGRAGVDYPTYATIPKTKFDCSTQRYKGFFGDPDTNCQVWHYCDLNGGQASFLCPNGTIFSQVGLTCDWWFNVRCATTSQLYVLNERLYKYILPFTPSFPEDYSGPLVDRYLTAKFKEMEAKSRIKALKALISTTKPESPTEGESSTDSPESSGSSKEVGGAAVHEDAEESEDSEEQQYSDDGDNATE